MPWRPGDLAGNTCRGACRDPVIDEDHSSPAAHALRRTVHTTAPEEAAAPTRRAYLNVLFGLGAVAAVVALVVAAYLLFRDVVAGTVGVETARRMRFAIGVLLAGPAIAAGAAHPDVCYRDGEFLLLDVADGPPEGFSLAAGSDERHFVTRSAACATPDPGA